MSLQNYLVIHKLSAQRPSWQAGDFPLSPPLKGRPQTGLNGIYFMYQDGEDFKDRREIYQRIVYVGINEVHGRLADRIKDYGRDWGTSLHTHVHRALAAKRGGYHELITAWDVTSFIKQNFRYRYVTVPSTKDAQFWSGRLSQPSSSIPLGL